MAALPSVQITEAAGSFVSAATSGGNILMASTLAGSVASFKTTPPYDGSRRSSASVTFKLTGATITSESIWLSLFGANGTDRYTATVKFGSSDAHQIALERWFGGSLASLQSFVSPVDPFPTNASMTLLMRKLTSGGPTTITAYVIREPHNPYSN